MASNDPPAGARPVVDPGTDDDSRPRDRNGGATLDALECALTDEFLVERGHTRESIRMLPAALREELLGAAAEQTQARRDRVPGALRQGSRTLNGKIVYWHRELPPLHAVPLSEHVVEADSMHVSGSLDHRGDLWDRCYQDLMTRLEDRLIQEAGRLGGHYAHVLGESIDSRHDDRSSEVWLRGRLKYLLLRRPGAN